MMFGKVLFFACILIFGQCSILQSFTLTGSLAADPQAPRPKSLAEAIEMTNSVMDSVMNKQAVPSMVFGISIHNKTIHRRAKGLIDIENYIPANITAMYRMASVSKTFTTTMLASLVDQGKLNFDDSIYKHLPVEAYPPKTFNGEPVDITVGQVSSHMAGMHFTNLTDFFNITFPMTSTESLKFRSTEPLYFKPGTD